MPNNSPGVSSPHVGHEIHGDLIHLPGPKPSISIPTNWRTIMPTYLAWNWAKVGVADLSVHES